MVKAASVPWLRLIVITDTTVQKYFIPQQPFPAATSAIIMILGLMLTFMTKTAAESRKRLTTSQWSALQGLANFGLKAIVTNIKTAADITALTPDTAANLKHGCAWLITARSAIPKDYAQLVKPVTKSVPAEVIMASV